MESNKKSLNGSYKKRRERQVNVVSKNTKIIVIALLTIILIIAFILIILLFGGCFLPNPGSPKVIYHEFPICLEYTLNGEYTKIEDVLICEFDGVGFNEGNGKYRKWKAHLKSGKNRITLFKDETVEIYYFPVKEDSRLPGVFMGDTEFYSGGTGETFPDAWYTTNYEDPTVNDYIISADDMKETYHLQLINWESSHPIDNMFE